MSKFKIDALTYCLHIHFYTSKLIEGLGLPVDCLPLFHLSAEGGERSSG